MLTMRADTDLLVVCSSGCLADPTRFVAARTGVPFVSVATAPSMDGYSGSGSPMIHPGHKRTITAAAPYDMITSGFSDTTGKLTSRVDWKLSDIVRNEYYRPLFVEAVDRLQRRGPRLFFPRQMRRTDVPTAADAPS